VDIAVPSVPTASPRSAALRAYPPVRPIIFHKAGIPRPVIADSCHSLEEEGADADSHGAGFAVFGPVFGKGTEQGLEAEL